MVYEEMNIAHIIACDKVSDTMLRSIDDIVSNCRMFFGKEIVTRLQVSVLTIGDAANTADYK